MISFIFFNLIINQLIQIKKAHGTPASRIKRSTSAVDIKNSSRSNSVISMLLFYLIKKKESVCVLSANWMIF